MQVEVRRWVRKADTALRWAERIRLELRARLGLKAQMVGQSEAARTPRLRRLHEIALGVSDFRHLRDKSQQSGTFGEAIALRFAAKPR